MLLRCTDRELSSKVRHKISLSLSLRHQQRCFSVQRCATPTTISCDMIVLTCRTGKRVCETIVRAWVCVWKRRKSEADDDSDDTARCMWFVWEILFSNNQYAMTYYCFMRNTLMIVKIISALSLSAPPSLSLYHQYCSFGLVFAPQKKNTTQSHAPSKKNAVLRLQIMKGVIFGKHAIFKITLTSATKFTKLQLKLKTKFKTFTKHIHKTSQNIMKVYSILLGMLGLASANVYVFVSKRSSIFFFLFVRSTLTSRKSSHKHSQTHTGTQKK